MCADLGVFALIHNERPARDGGQRVIFGRKRRRNRKHLSTRRLPSQVWTHAISRFDGGFSPR